MRAPAFPLGCLGLLLAGAGAMRADPDLVANSPFLPPGAAAAPAVAAQGAIFELHGIMTTPDGTRFSIYNSAKKSATWVGLNETGPDFVVRSHKVVDGSDQVTMDYQGNTLTLGLKTSKIAASAAAVAGQTAGGIPVGQPGGRNFRGGGPGGQNAAAVLPADEAARLQAAVADARRRQMLRAQAAQNPDAPQAVAAPDPSGQAGAQNGQRIRGGQRQRQQP